MDIKYRRKLSKNKRTVHKECTKCNTVWMDDQIIDGGHDYGEDNCPFCHQRWEAEVEITLETPKVKKTKVLERKVFRLQERLKVIDAMIFVHEGTGVTGNAEDEGCDWSLEYNVTQVQRMRNQHISDLGTLAGLHRERTWVLGKITGFEDSLSKDWGYVEPKGIRLEDGQMDWPAAYANMKAYRDGLSI